MAPPHGDRFLFLERGLAHYMRELSHGNGILAVGYRVVE